ncbi:hypothetical protein E3N88_11659 [Mikania micrantha]|uniref:Dirigent protein n=1 Tax=Mikania micrantha TaxID=192012 RepID=A0A5N6P3D1_9ASTR|nr:hypothetical protein E3N88_11659 [Mikania micrantha]
MPTTFVVGKKYSYADDSSTPQVDDFSSLLSIPTDMSSVKEGIRLGIHAECQRAYKDRKQEFKKYFDKVGGYGDIVKAKGKPPEHMDQEAWEQLIDELFLDPDFRKRSEKNKSNRSKQRYTSFHGSKSYAQRRHMEALVALKFSKRLISRSEKGWANEITELDYGERKLGFYGLSSQEELGLLMVMNFVFMTGRYNGSTLTVLGRNPVMQKVREMPVIGGTALFRVSGIPQFTVVV